MKIKVFKKFISYIVLIIIFCVFTLPNCISADTGDDPKSDSPSVILMDFRTGKILYEKNSHEKKYPASITKVMTAIVVLEHCKLDDVTTVSHNAVYSIEPGYVIANLKEGEELTIDQLLHILLIASANDAAVVLAEYVSGSVENFSDLMNEKAKEIGCKDTHFINPDGAHDENHYSTAYDLALIGRYAMQNETFRNIVSNTSYNLPATNKYSKNDRLFTTTNSLLTTSSIYYYKYATRN